MPSRTIRLVREGFPERMPLDTAVSRVLLTEASRGALAETIRLTVPGRSVAFGKHDLVSPGFVPAMEAARAGGFEPFVRLAGGRAAVFHERTIGLSWVMPESRPVDRIGARFADAAGVLVDALASLGISAGIGAVPGEYCPGAFSIHVGPAKVAGLGQRLTRSAAHIGGVIVVDGSDTIRRVLVPVYESLGLEWNPATAGSLSDSLPGLTGAAVIEAIVDRLRAEATIEEAELTQETVTAAEGIAAGFAPS